MAFDHQRFMQCLRSGTPYSPCYWRGCKGSLYPVAPDLDDQDVRLPIPWKRYELRCNLNPRHEVVSPHGRTVEDAQHDAR